MRRLLLAAYFLEVGLLLVILPWTTFWDRNYLFDLVPVVRDWLHSSYARGAVSGLGLLMPSLWPVLRALFGIKGLCPAFKSRTRDARPVARCLGWVTGN